MQYRSPVNEQHLLGLWACRESSQPHGKCSSTPWEQAKGGKPGRPCCRPSKVAEALSAARSAAHNVQQCNTAMLAMHAC